MRTYSVEERIRMLRELEVCLITHETVRKHNINEQTEHRTVQVFLLTIQPVQKTGASQLGVGKLLKLQTVNDKPPKFC